MGPILLFEDFAIPAPGANADIMAANLTIPQGVFTLRIAVNLAVASVFKARIGDGTNEYDEKANAGSALSANTGYEFDLAVTPGNLVNFQVETDGIIQRLRVVGLAEERS